MAPRVPLTRDRPFAWEALASLGNSPVNVRSEHIPLFAEVAEELLPDPRERLFRDQGNGSRGNAFFSFSLSTRGVTLGGFQCDSSLSAFYLAEHLGKEKHGRG